MALITVKDLSLGYEGKEIVSHLSFTIEEGSYLCIVGENGAGKSTLMKTMLQLMPQISGDIQFKQGFQKSDIGYLPQQTLIQKDFPASVKEIVISGCQSGMGLFPFYGKKEKTKADAIMKEMGISEIKDTCYRDLSGGQQQRVLLARALCSNPKILFLDEPVTGLDPKVTEELYERIQSINKQGTTIVMISHDIETAMQYASHVLHIGKQIFSGTKEAYLKTPLGKDYIQMEGRNND